MKLAERFSIGQILHVGAMVSHLAVDRQSGETLVLHVAYSPEREQDGLLQSILNLPPDARRFILDFGKEETITYALTYNHPEMYDLVSWCSERLGLADRNKDPLLTQRVWKLAQGDRLSGGIKQIGHDEPTSPAEEPALTAFLDLDAGVSNSASGAHAFGSILSDTQTVSVSKFWNAQDRMTNLEPAHEHPSRMDSNAASEISPHVTRSELYPLASAELSSESDNAGPLKPGEFTQLFAAIPEARIDAPAVATPLEPDNGVKHSMVGAKPIETFSNPVSDQKRTEVVREISTPTAHGTPTLAAAPLTTSEQPISSSEYSARNLPNSSISLPSETSTLFQSSRQRLPIFEGNTSSFQSGFVPAAPSGLERGDESKLISEKPSVAGSLSATRVFRRVPSVSEPSRLEAYSKLKANIGQNVSTKSEQLIGSTQPDQSKTPSFPFLFVLTLVTLFLLALALVLFFAIER